METQKDEFVCKPGKDFSRTRKQSFQNIFKFILSMENDAIKRELMKFFAFSSDAPTDSAFNQQRAKIKAYAFEYLFRRFTEEIKDEKNHRGYRLIACDGSSLNMFCNPNDQESYYTTNPTTKGCNLLHLNTLYDLNNRKYLDAVIQPIHHRDERSALRIMVDRLQLDVPEKTIIIADRGYQAINVFESIHQKGMKYLIRIKAIDPKKPLYGVQLPNSDEFDVNKTLYFTHSRSKKKFHINRDKNLIYIRKTKRNKILDIHDIYPIKLRFVKFALNDKTFEYLVTNLSKEEFSSEELKELYGMRWGIESSYKELKYAAGLINVHAKKREYVEQEIWARLTLFNYSEAIALRISVERQKKKKENKYEYQLNYTTVLYLCRLYLKLYPLINAVQLETIIECNILPIRQGRTAFRTERPRTPVRFCYRTS